MTGHAPHRLRHNGNRNHPQPLQQTMINDIPIISVACPYRTPWYCKKQADFVKKTAIAD